MSDDPRRALILINRSAGTGHAQDDTLDIISRFACSGYEPVVYPIIPGTGLTSEKIIERYRDNVDVILCSGGDGTLNHVMSAVMELDTDKKPVLAYIPAGSTNDFAKGLNIPEGREGALMRAIDGTAFAYDVGQMGERYFNYVAAFGAFSEISYDTDQELKNVFGYAAYVISAIMKLPRNIGYSCHMRIEGDGISEEGEYIFGAVCNSFSVGGMKLFGACKRRVQHRAHIALEIIILRVEYAFFRKRRGDRIRVGAPCIEGEGFSGHRKDRRKGVEDFHA